VVRTREHPLDRVGPVDPLFLDHLVLADDVDRRLGGDDREDVDLRLAEFPVFDLHDILRREGVGGDVHADRDALAAGAVDP
jgi:hypothetical protein